VVWGDLVVINVMDSVLFIFFVQAIETRNQMLEADVRYYYMPCRCIPRGYSLNECVI